MNNENPEEIMLTAGSLYMHIVLASTLKTELIVEFTEDYEKNFLEKMVLYEKRRNFMEYSLEGHITDTDSEESLKFIKENLNKNKELYNVNYVSAVTMAHEITVYLFDLDYSENRGQIVTGDDITCLMVNTLIMTLYAVKTDITACLEEYLLYLLKRNKKD